MPKRTEIGVVVSDKMQKTRRVEIAGQSRHAVYGKIMRHRTICYIHDEANEAKLGDKVEIIEARPRSHSKRWELLRIVEKRGDMDVVALKAAREAAELEAKTLSK